MAFASAAPPHEPLSEINTTPLIDVLLVLLIVFVMSIPIATNSLPVDLPQPGPGEVNPVKNLLAVETDGDAVWNGRPVGDAELAGLLARVRATAPEPEVQFRPDANASYERSAQVLLIVKQSRIDNFGFLDNEKYQTFSRDYGR